MSEAMNEKKQRLLRIAPALLVEMFKSGRRQYEVLENAVPDDARIVAVGLFDEEVIGPARQIYILIESDTLPDAEWREGDPIPELVPKVTGR